MFEIINLRPNKYKKLYDNIILRYLTPNELSKKLLKNVEKEAVGHVFIQSKFVVWDWEGTKFCFE